ncbi:MAG TPA: hypothetical protein VF681_10795 [Abditibacteriaceae bacterium]|jgi:hypothetical protein
MSNEATNTNLPSEDEDHFKPGALADAAIESEATHVSPDAESDVQAGTESEGGVDNGPPLSRAQRRAAQFNKGATSSGPRAPFAGGKSVAPGATGADRVAPIPTKHAGRGK